MRYWLVKQEPGAFSWTAFVAEGCTAWTGVRSFQARNHLRSMEKNDLVLFYHSVTDKCVVGLACVEKAAYPDPTAEDGDWSCVDIVPVRAFPKHVSLDQIKSDPLLRELPLVRQARLSVMPIEGTQFARICKLGQVDL